MVESSHSIVYHGLDDVHVDHWQQFVRVVLHVHHLCAQHIQRIQVVTLVAKQRAEDTCIRSKK